MSTITRVVVGLDPDRASAAALDWAAAYARNIGAALRAVHVRSESSTPDLCSDRRAILDRALGLDTWRDPTNWHDPTWVAVRHLFDRVDPEPSWTLIRIRGGRVGPELVKIAYPPALLVLGIASPLRSAWLVAGTSVAGYCLRHAEVPVVCVPIPHDNAESGSRCGRPRHLAVSDPLPRPVAGNDRPPAVVRTP